MDKPNQYETYPLYLKITCTGLFLLSGIWWFILFLLWPGLQRFGFAGAITIEVILGILPAFFLFMWGVMAIAVTGIVKFPHQLMYLSNRSLYFFFPYIVLLGALFGLSKERISQSLIDLINHLVQLHLYTVPPERLLLLTPHCLQLNTCVHKVTTDIHNCKQCGGCQVGDLLRISQTYGCSFVVVTGGTLARMMVKKARPQAIIAIACERDLVSGMQDVFPVPVIGVLNERPCGPCCNTKVDIKRIETVVQELIYGKARKD